MAKRYDVIVIGGGHNGLVNAAYLAKAGKKVKQAVARPTLVWLGDAALKELVEKVNAAVAGRPVITSAARPVATRVVISRPR